MSISDCPTASRLTLTPRHLDRAEAWLDAYMDRFAEDGYTPDHCAHVRSHIAALPWVLNIDEAFDRSLSWQLRRHPDPTATLAEVDDYMAGWRTLASISDEERLGAIADRLGIRVDEVRKMAAKVEAASEREPDMPASTPCALYRHYDDSGVLLYVGISIKPDERAEQHRRNSPWFPLSVRCEVEWFDSAADAHDVERQAIDLESPLFNKAHNATRQHLAVAYLFERLGAFITGGAA